MMIRRAFDFVSIAFCAVVMVSGSVSAAPYGKGDAVEVFSAKDQHGKDFTLDPANAKFVLFSQDMDAGKAANVVLDALGKDYLKSKDAVFIANIHGMPGIGRTFALPKMRKYSHTIVLGDDAGLLAKFPATKGKVTVLKLAGGKVVSVSYWDPAAEKVDDRLK